MNGILNVLKPAGMTSFDIVGFLRKASGQKKIGHTGTLDPSAVGVLPVCFGNATKAIEFMIDKDKVYRAELTLGCATDTQDSSGKPVYVREVEAGEEEISSVIKSFTGELQQLPPMYSAIKIGGKKLYELARRGETVERQPRNITIYSIEIIGMRDEPSSIALNDGISGSGRSIRLKKVLLDVHCSKGTYIRTLCHDIGERLGCGGHMSFLVRTAAGQYPLDTALTIEEIKESALNGTLENRMLPVETVFTGYEEIFLDEKETFKYKNGVWIGTISENPSTAALKRVYDNKNIFLGVGEVFHNEGSAFLKSKKFF